jgi:xylulokinase
VAPGASVGTVRADVARATGLPPDAVVVAGITDSHAFALATGAAVPGRIGVVIGTTAVLLATTDRFGSDPDSDVLAMPGVEPGEYLVWAENGLAGRVVEQILTAFVHGTDALGDHAADDVFQGFDAALVASPPGAAGVRFLPWFSGAMAPVADPSMRGGFLGVSLDTRRVDLVRAVAEGVAHNIRWLLGPVAARAGDAAAEVVLAGGAARSPAWSQIVADVVGLPVRVLADPDHAGSRAVAAWAGRQVAGRPDEEPTADRPGPGSSWGRRHAPDPGSLAVHDAAHEQFTAAFHALRPLRLGRRPS